MTEPCYCPRCRAAITADSPAGLCPSCLMQMALERTGEAALPAIHPVRSEKGRWNFGT
jgi:hypothetical protein